MLVGDPGGWLECGSNIRSQSIGGRRPWTRLGDWPAGFWAPGSASVISGVEWIGGPLGPQIRFVHELGQALVQRGFFRQHEIGFLQPEVEKLGFEV